MTAPRSLRPFCLAMVVVLVAPFSGCSEPDPIISYTIPTKVPPELIAGKDRMVAVMLPRASDVWFFKVTGPEQAIAEVEDQIREFVAGVSFDGDNPDLKELPADWRKAGDRPMRFASINIDTSDKQLDLSISKLSRQEDWDAQVKMNVNRWRNQVGLEPSDQKWGGGEAMEIASADAAGIWVNLTGQTSGGGSMSPPFAGGDSLPGGPFSEAGGRLPPDHPPIDTPPDAATPETAPTQPQTDERLTYDRPEGWRDGRMSSMRMAAFNVGPEDAPAEITIIPAGGDLKGNVKRWMEQVREAEVTDEQLDQAMADASEVNISGLAGKRYVLVGDQETIDATILPMDNGMSLFIKMKGPAATVADQADAIDQFLKSLKLNL